MTEEPETPEVEEPEATPETPGFLVTPEAAFAEDQYIHTFSSTSFTPIDRQFKGGGIYVKEIKLEGDLETGDKTAIEINGLPILTRYGTFKWCVNYHVKTLKIEFTFTDSRIGMLTITYQGYPIASETTGTSAALPADLQGRF